MLGSRPSITSTLLKAAAGGRGGSWYVLPAAQDFDPARAHLDGGGPLHAGAARYFRETGQLR